MPSILLLRKIGAANQLEGIAFCWGVVMIGQGFVKSWQSLTVTRPLIGAFKAGFFPACVWLISNWYVRRESQVRMSAFNLISVGIAYFVVIDFPDKAAGRGFLTMAERDMILTRIERDRADSKADALAWAKAARYATDLKAALLIASAPYWTALVAAFCTALVADRYFIRMPILIGQCILTIAGLGMLFVTTNRKVQLAGCFLGVFGTNANIPFVLNFSQNNVPGQAKKSFTSVIVIMFGGIGGIFTSLAYNENDAPLYRKGLYATIACQVFVLLCGIGFTVYFYAANKKIRAGRKVVDDRPGFTYTI
uniref:Allantoate permease n=1 Tax=Melanopsichium pennsylvanicum 4 TaxID=1398559 RepID=A0A077QZC8_9BASI|nr:conserved hypothetical protein [Melanopsichium pennsylvanicum 4]